MSPHLQIKIHLPLPHPSPAAPPPFLFPYITGPRGAENRKGLSFTSHIPRTIRAPLGAAGGPGGRSAPARRAAPVGCARSQSRPGGGRCGRRAPLRSPSRRRGSPRCPAGLLLTFVSLSDAGAVPTHPRGGGWRGAARGCPRAGARPSGRTRRRSRRGRSAGPARLREVWGWAARRARARRGSRWGSAGRSRAGPAPVCPRAARGRRLCPAPDSHSTGTLRALNPDRVITHRASNFYARVLLAEEEPLANKFHDLEIKSIVAKRLQAVLFLISGISNAPHTPRGRGGCSPRARRPPHVAPVRARKVTQ